MKHPAVEDIRVRAARAVVVCGRTDERVLRWDQRVEQSGAYLPNRIAAHRGKVDVVSVLISAAALRSRARRVHDGGETVETHHPRRRQAVRPNRVRDFDQLILVRDAVVCVPAAERRASQSHHAKARRKESRIDSLHRRH